MQYQEEMRFIPKTEVFREMIKNNAAVDANQTDKLLALEERVAKLEQKLAMKDLESGGNVDIVLASDIKQATAVTIKANSTTKMDLNGKTIAPTEVNIDGLIAEEGGTLILNGDGRVETMDGGNGFPVIAYGHIIINDGNYISNNDAEGYANACIYAKGNGKIEIYGGYFKTPDGTFTLNLHDGSRETASITVYGGTFVNFDPSNNASEGPNTNFVAKGYVVKESTDEQGNKIYTVVKA